MAKFRHRNTALLNSRATAPPGYCTVEGDLRDYCEGSRRREALTVHAIIESDFNLVFTGLECTGVDQPGKRQALTSVIDLAPVFRLFAQFLAVFDQHIFNINSWSKQSLVDRGVVNLKVEADWLVFMEYARDIRNYFLCAYGELSATRTVRQIFKACGQNNT